MLIIWTSGGGGITPIAIPLATPLLVTKTVFNRINEAMAVALLIFLIHDVSYRASRSETIFQVGPNGKFPTNGKHGRFDLEHSPIRYLY